MAHGTAPLTNRPEAPADELDRLRQRVDDLRVAIGWDVDEVRSRVREAFDLRRQVARHPFIAAAVVLGGLFVATRLVRRLRGVRAPGARRPRRGLGRDFRAVAPGPGREPGTREAHTKEACE